MTREQANKELIDHLQSDYDLTIRECKETFEFELVNKIFDHFEKELKPLSEVVMFDNGRGVQE